MSKRHAEISKLLSFVLRHQPEAIGLTLDVEGWANIQELIVAAANNGKLLDLNLIQAVVTTSDKKRFAISEDGLRIRAAQGHSTESVDINHIEKVPPEFLYHGTATRFIESIRNPVVLKIKALLMHEQGFKFCQAENGVWLVKLVPAAFTTE